MSVLLEYAYRALRPVLFALPPETAHEVTLAGLRGLGATLGRAVSLPSARQPQPVRLFGLDFPSRVGLAAGLDKDGVAPLGLATLGFGFVELGTVTPRPQPGNPLPRLRRFRDADALVNRMGFNNLGSAALARSLAAVRPRLAGVPVGVNIGKNKHTPLDRAAEDYCRALGDVHEVADYVTVNLSSPNTPGLRELQGSAEITELVGSVLRERERLGRAESLPVLIKVAPDLAPAAVRELASVLRDLGPDGVIATNTTITRPNGIADGEAGGLSGVPLRELSLRVVAELADALQGAMPIVGVGGIDSLAAAQQFRRAGAELVQLYTGLIYRGPALVRRLAQQLD
ncbi:MAG: quinone-dependent dihydroorotate dehydrogenase [Pseudomonadota bacterium]